jgi:hypothetical protein
MDAVLPILRKDFERANLLFRSLLQNFRDLGTLFLVTREAELGAMRALTRSLPRRLDVRVESEFTIAPELRLTRSDGWYRQQLVKLAIAGHVTSDLYLTLDADVVCTRSVSAADLAPGARGLCHVLNEDSHPLWYQRSLKVLGLPAVRTGILHNVTPAVLHRGAVRELAEFFAERARSKSYAPGLRGIRQALTLGLARALGGRPYEPWRVMLAAGVPWTEYSLYYSFLEATGNFDRFHVESPHCIYDVERSVWYRERTSFGDWDPAPCFVGSGPPWFVVVQSNTGLEPRRVEAKFAPYFAESW